MLAISQAGRIIGRRTVGTSPKLIGSRRFVVVFGANNNVARGRQTVARTHQRQKAAASSNSAVRRRLLTTTTNATRPQQPRLRRIPPLKNLPQLLQEHQQHQQRRSIHFLPLVGLWGAKHLSAWTIYNACKAYGWPRVYRRLLEQNRILNRNANPAVLQSTKQLIRMAIETPPKFAVQLGQHSTQVIGFLTRVAERTEPNLPRFLVAAIKFVVQSQKPIKILQDFMGAASSAKK